MSGLLKPTWMYVPRCNPLVLRQTRQSCQKERKHCIETLTHETLIQAASWFSLESGQLAAPQDHFNVANLSYVVGKHNQCMIMGMIFSQDCSTTLGLWKENDLV